jgi:hypothetical protein
VAAEIIHDDNVARAQSGDQELLDIGAKADAVDRPSMTQGAVMRSWRNAARKASVRQRPWYLGDQASAATSARAGGSC